MPKIVDKDEMRTAILDAAMSVFVAKGYHGASISNVAVAAGLGKGTLYLYFDSKDALTTALVERHFAMISDGIMSAAPCETLKAFLDDLSGTLDVPAEQASFHRVFFEVFGPSFASDAFSETIAGFFDKLGSHYARRIAHLQANGEIATHRDAPALGRVIASMLDGIILHQGLFSISKRRHRRMIKEAVTVLGDGLRAGKDIGTRTHSSAARRDREGNDTVEVQSTTDLSTGEAEPTLRPDKPVRKRPRKSVKRLAEKGDPPEQFDFLQQWPGET